MRLKRWVRLAVALGLAGGAIVALVTGPLTPALGFESRGLVLHVTVQSPATLAARGAAVNVSVKVECTVPKNEYSELDVLVTERVGSRIAQGQGFLSPVGCTGQSQTITVTVPSFSGQAFKRGYAQAQADLFGCGFRVCGQESDSEVIQIVKAAH